MKTRKLSFMCKTCNHDFDNMIHLKAHYQKEPSHNPVNKPVAFHRRRRKDLITPSLKTRVPRRHVMSEPMLQFCPHCGKNLKVIQQAMVIAEQTK
ncbi:MAG: hypothetical protein Q8P20_09900 [bacterium]|nr:hypothetical protein [bacterium]